MDIIIKGKTYKVTGGIKEAKVPDSSYYQSSPIILPTKSVQNANWEWQKKELISKLSLYVVGHRAWDEQMIIDTLMDIEWYMGRSNSAMTMYCNVRYNFSGETYGSGRGTAGGGGYCKKSASAAAALESAGFQVHEISGRGVTVLEKALQNIAYQLGYSVVMVR